MRHIGHATMHSRVGHDKSSGKRTANSGHLQKGRRRGGSDPACTSQHQHMLSAVIVAAGALQLLRWNGIRGYNSCCAPTLGPPQSCWLSLELQ